MGFATKPCRVLTLLATHNITPIAAQPLASDPTLDGSCRKPRRVLAMPASHLQLLTTYKLHCTEWLMQQSPEGYSRCCNAQPYICNNATTTLHMQQCSHIKLPCTGLLVSKRPEGSSRCQPRTTLYLHLLTTCKLPSTNWLLQQGPDAPHAATARNRTLHYELSNHLQAILAQMAYATNAPKGPHAAGKSQPFICSCAIICKLPNIRWLLPQSPQGSLQCQPHTTLYLQLCNEMQATLCRAASATLQRVRTQPATHHRTPAATQPLASNPAQDDLPQNPKGSSCCQPRTTLHLQLLTICKLPYSKWLLPQSPNASSQYHTHNLIHVAA